MLARNSERGAGAGSLHRRPQRFHQRGATLVTAALVTFMLLGFIGMAIDIGRLFVIKSELQTAMDACALAAVQELDSQADAIIRARNAGKKASDLNRVNFQSTNWAGLGLLDETTDITFRAEDFITPTTNPTLARYAQCQHMHVGVTTWLLQALGNFRGADGVADPLLTTNTKNIFALAIATRGPAQTTCPLPLALRPKDTSGPPNFGYTPGEWVTLLTKNDTGKPGYVGWANLDGTNSASETEKEMDGKCGVTIGTTLGTPGVQSNIADNWNWRFGIYKKASDLQDPANLPRMLPDQTGYIYNAVTWPSQNNAYNDFASKRIEFANCPETSTGGNKALKACDKLLKNTIKFQGGNDLIPGGKDTTGGHEDYGVNRRVVLVPVTNGYPGSVADYACMLMLQPLSRGLNAKNELEIDGDVQLEFIGNAGDPGSPCSTSGTPGGVAGPLVPVLVR